MGIFPPPGYEANAEQLVNLRAIRPGIHLRSWCAEVLRADRVCQMYTGSNRHRSDANTLQPLRNYQGTRLPVEANCSQVSNSI